MGGSPLAPGNWPVKTATNEDRIITPAMTPGPVTQRGGGAKTRLPLPLQDQTRLQAKAQPCAPARQ